jgi:hypothetical protein
METEEMLKKSGVDTVTISCNGHKNNLPLHQLQTGLRMKVIMLTIFLTWMLQILLVDDQFFAHLF